ncbi:MAG TPA: ATPase [Thermopetrobacter sp.]|nr:ATPase [Thermopetrobacter sp.]
MRFASGREYLAWPRKAVTIFGMSGVGKTTLGRKLRHEDWFLYSVDYRIGTRYMNEHIVDNFKREAMRVPLLRQLLRSDSIYISSNITFENLEPLATYLGKPGDPARGGLSFEEYRRRQAQHRHGEIQALLDVPVFIRKAEDIYGYDHFLCDTGGSLCEVIDFNNPADPVAMTLADNTVLLYIRETEEHVATLVERFRRQPKPMYYHPRFLERVWADYKATHGIDRDEDVDPDDFAIYGFERLIGHRRPLYERIARRWGYTAGMDEIQKVRGEEDFNALLADIIDRARDGGG